jgi:hypothetical protein
MSKNRKAYPFRASCVRDDFDEDDDDYRDGGGSASVRPLLPQHPEFTGIITASGERIFRVFMEQPDLGFLSEALNEYDPNAFYYGIEPTLEPLYLEDEEDHEETD